jgi:hypothetical protein
MLSFAIFACFCAVYLFNLSVLGLLFFTIWTGLGTFSLYVALRIILSAERITLNHWNSTMTLRYGYLPFAKALTVFAEQLQAKMYRCDYNSPNPAPSPGSTVLSLIKKNGNGSEFILAAASTKSLLSPFCDKLADFLNTDVLDETIRQIQLPNAEIVNVSTTSVTGGTDAGEKKRAFSVISDNVALFTRKLRHDLIWLLGAGMGVFIAVTPLIEPEQGENTTTFWAVFLLAFPVGLLVFTGSLYFLVKFSRRRYLMVDKTKGIVSFKSFLRSPSDGRLICVLSEIAAVQICSVVTVVSSGNSARHTTIYEINLVLNSSSDKRINITSSAQGQQMCDDAARFAEFLGVPVIDHT